MTDSRSRRWVLHLDMDAFFASVEQLTRPTLRGRPVLVGGAGGRGVVAGCSYEARVFGARSAMPMHQARRLVGAGAVVLPPRGALYQVLSRRVFESLRTRMPVLEQLSLDEAFGEPAELAGATAAEVEEFCESLRALVREETGLICSLGAGSGKQIAKIASGLAKPDGVTVVSPGEQTALMAALPVRKLWGIGPVADEKLRRLGIDTIGKFVATPESEVASILGGTVGPSLHKLARGIDDRAVAERAEAKQVSAETTFAHDLVTLAQLRAAVDKSADAAHRRLLKDGRGARTIVLKLRKSDMSIVTRSVTLPYATVDKQTIVAAAQRQVLDPVELGPIRLVGVGLAGLSAVQQGSLFPELEHDSEDSPREQTTAAEIVASVREHGPKWHPGMDVRHPEYGHGWVQGAGHSVVTVRFETRSSGPGRARTFAEGDTMLEVADALGSLE
ncbi:DNA polymerase IV [Rhodococcus sp. BP-252]|uniref:DNA polymerase IV n=1 Tax=Rhodococcoides kyotonense TaxID=398843 RepID=A0A177YQZ3_9NOCA|nr:MULTISPECIES: DNA polymerase IV [Rhodococcus]MBY6411340.1 DNA polymerase IV [Rhodococcus sp. BP-320]MBY6415999.1 DNA polymerase IV [Rhodococcus sp. BP-321]MBY6420492.1 DNA polymerase IV [Rhodococcus sp. BP-324]MBY6426206.1 DNA polymerase IV [Rhodococcus sp. BP-323]MBY6431253.1 DNA polymerase IV [Rhodococcus sp. BP-322]